MAKLFAPLNGAWEVLTLRATVAVFVMMADDGTVAFTAIIAPLIVIANSCSMTLPALTRPPVVLAKR